jgi:hypothetical protein
MEIVISVLFFLVLLVFLRTRSFFQSPELNPWMLPFAFALKCSVGFIFLQLYVFQYDNPQLKTDAGAFFHESKILNTVYNESPNDYFKLMSGIGATDALSEKYLGETNHWDSGDQAIFHDNRNIIRIHALLQYISLGSIVVHMIFFSFLSLLGTYLLFLALRNRGSVKPWVIFLLLLLLPNIIFWSSGILKEPIILFGIGALAYAITDKTSNLKKWGFGILGLIALLSFKPYIFIALIPSGIVYALYSYLPRYKLATSIGIPLLLGFIFMLSFPSVLEKGTHILSRKQSDFSNVGRGGMHVKSEQDSIFYYFTPDQYNYLTISGDSVWLNEEIDAYKVKFGSLVPPVPARLKPTKIAWTHHFSQDRANSFIEINPINDQPIRLLTSAHIAIFNTLFRPLPTDPGGTFKYLAFLETLFLFGLIAWTLLRHKPLSTKERGFILASVVFCLLLSLLIGWTTPVLGAIHRYRFPIQLAMIVCIIVAWKPNGFLSKLNHKT